MRAFVLCMLLQALLLVVVFGGVWKYTAHIIEREDELLSYVLPNLELAHHFTSATSGLQSQGLLLRSASTIDDLQLRRQLLEDAIRETRILIQSGPALSGFDTARLASIVDQIQQVVTGLTDVRARQLLATAQLNQDSERLIVSLDELFKQVQDRVVTLTDNLLDIREKLSLFTDDGVDVQSGAMLDIKNYNSALDQFESNSLIIQDYLLFNQDLIGLRSILERLPLIDTRERISLAEQQRDLLMQAMVSRAIYISDKGGTGLLLTSLTRIRVELRGQDNLFASRLAALDTDEKQMELSERLTELTIEAPAMTEEIRADAESVLYKVTAATRQGLERYRWFLFFALILSMLVLGSIGYWLLYRRTVVPLGEIASRLDDVGTLRFLPPTQTYFIQEIRVLSQVVGDLDRVQKDMQRKDLELESSNRELRSALGDLEQFVHVASHDLQEPLRKLQQFSGLMEEDYGDKLDEDGKFYLEAIGKSAQRMSTMIRDTLAYARSARQDVTEEALDLNDLLPLLYEDIDIAVAEAGARINVGKLPTVMASRTGMSQLFLNLMLNAVKYRRKEVPCVIDIQARYPVDEPVVIIDVQDNGIGIEEKFLERVFVPFERLCSQQVSGTGLGLAICTKVCEAHGWRIWVTSEPGVGSCFHISLPRDSVVR